MELLCGCCGTLRGTLRCTVLVGHTVRATCPPDISANTRHIIIYVWFQPVSSPQHMGSGQKTQLLHGRLAFLGFLACAAHRSQQSCALSARWLMPKTTAWPPVSEWGL